MSTSPTKWSGPRYIWTGLIVAVAGTWFGKLGLDAWRSGKPVPMPHSPALEGWAVLGMGAFLVFLGLCFVAVGLGWMKPRGPQ